MDYLCVLDTSHSQFGSSMVSNEAYKPLKDVLDAAYYRAAFGKGKERHALGLPFNEQPILYIQRALGNNGFALGQIIKKCQEASRFPKDRAVDELHDVIVYAAAAIIWLKEQKDDIGSQPNPGVQAAFAHGGEGHTERNVLRS